MQNPSVEPKLLQVSLHDFGVQKESLAVFPVSAGSFASHDSLTGLQTCRRMKHYLPQNSAQHGRLIGRFCFERYAVHLACGSILLELFYRRSFQRKAVPHYSPIEILSKVSQRADTLTLNMSSETFVARGTLCWSLPSSIFF